PGCRGKSHKHRKLRRRAAFLPRSKRKVLRDESPGALRVSDSVAKNSEGQILKIRMTVLTAALVIVVVGAPAYPQNRDILQLQKDMIDVTQRVNQLQTTIDRDNALMKGLMEKIADQVNTLTGN